MNFQFSIFNFQKQKCGQAAIIAVIFLLFILLSILGATSNLVLKEAKNVERNFRSKLAFFSAEAGVEDAVYRLRRGKNITNSFSIYLNGSVSSTTVSDILGGGKEVKSSAEFLENFKFLRSILFHGEGAEFFYGAQIGEGGLILENNTKIEGNVFSNGNVNGYSGTVITGSVTVASSGNGVTGVNVQGDVFADKCKDADIDGVLHTNNNDNCFYGSVQSLGAPSDSISLPISTEDIQVWKNDAQAGGVTNENIKLGGSDTTILGPRKIVGNLEIENSAIVILEGNLWVTGNVIVENNAQVRLSSLFGNRSGVIIADGTILLENNSISSGSGNAGSYLMYLSTKTGDSALTVKNDAKVDIIYTSVGGIVIENNTNLKEVMGYRVKIKNNAVLTYEFGLTNVNFLSGPSGGWSISEWKEVIQ